MRRDAEGATDLRIEYAFKEWAVVVDALGEGRQTVILRKGGIQEEGRVFRPEHREFFLFPTFEHQNEEDLVPEARFRLKEIQSRAPRPNDAIPIHYFAVLEESCKGADLAAIRSLRECHILSEPAIDKRFLWGRDKALHVLAVRVFRLREMFALKQVPSYSGCKSWVKLEEDIPTHGAEPVLSESQHQAKMGALAPLLRGAR